jgi:hypothetical protein
MKPQPIKVTLGEKEYEITPLPIAPAREVRHQFEAILTPIVDTLKTMPDTNLTDMTALAAIVSVVKDSLMGMVDIAFDLLLVYAPNLAADRQQIETTAYDDQVMLAFVEVAKLLYPFGSVIPSLTGLSLPQTRKK